MSKSHVHDVLDLIDEEAAAATEGPWVIRDLSEHEYGPDDNTGWWWVWQKSKLPYYGAVLNPNERTDQGQPDGSIGEAMIDDNKTGVQEKKDAQFMASARTRVPQLSAALREVVEMHHSITVNWKLPSEYESCVQCLGNSYPCDTVAAIEGHFPKEDDED